MIEPIQIAIDRAEIKISTGAYLGHVAGSFAASYGADDVLYYEVNAEKFESLHAALYAATGAAYAYVAQQENGAALDRRTRGL